MFSRTLVALALAAGPATAQTYRFEWEIGSTTYTSGSTAAAGGIGTSVDLKVYIRETGGSRLQSPGLATGGVLLTTSQPLTGLRVLTDNDIVGNVGAGGFTNTGAGFYVRQAAYIDPTEVVPTPRPDQHRLSLAANLGTGAVGTGPNGRLLLGTFTFTVQGTAATTITAGNIPDDDYNIVFGGPTLAVASATIQLVPVPEPAGLVAAVAGVLAATRWRAGRPSR